MPQVRSDPKERGVVKAEKAARVSKEQQQTTWLEESGGGGGGEFQVLQKLYFCKERTS